MNTIKKLIPLTLLGAVLLAGCAKTEPVDIGSNGPGSATSVTPAVQQDDESPAVAERQDYKKVSCSMLKLKENQENCEMQVNDFIAQELNSEITSIFDASRCGILPDFLAESCKSSIEQSGVTGPVSAADLAAFREAVNPTFPEPTEGDELLAEPPMPTYDKSKCATLKATGYKDYCEGIINSRLDQQKLDEIISGGDIKGCDTLASDNMKRDCKSFFGVFEEPELIVEEEPIVEEPPTETAPDTLMEEEEASTEPAV